MRKLIEGVKRAELLLLKALFVIIFIMVPLQAAIRYVFQESAAFLFWTNEFTTICLVWAAMIGTVYLTHERLHFRVTIIEEKLGRKWRAALTLFSGIICLAGVSLLLWSVLDGMTSAARRSTAVLQWNYGTIYYVPFAVILLVLLVVMTAVTYQDLTMKSHSSEQLLT